ncbi:MAG: UDP-N-acetylmuramate dehydrogenase, partial [Candidatus Omnitrophica bacterium]|nr:UDP-N-acetylmuramate dehydrogenase [Candidatus Omnitrophota bacterium]
MSLRTDLKVSLRRKVSLSQYTTMQVGGAAEYFAEPTVEEELVEALEFAAQENLPWMILGKGSNLIFADEGYPGLIISLLQYEKERIQFDTVHTRVTASSGVHLYRLAASCRAVGFGGAEFLAGIPGTVGGAVIMNAGFSRFPGQMSEIGDILEAVTFINPKGRKETRLRDELEFSYRKSSLEGNIILEAKLKLWKRTPEQIDHEMKANFDYRNTKQDLRYPSSGSIFKNPPAPALSAGRLIEQAGLKGVRIGGVMVSDKHGNYFVKVGPATSTDVIELIRKVQKSVFDATQVLLEPEVRIIQRS